MATKIVQTARTNRPHVLALNAAVVISDATTRTAYRNRGRAMAKTIVATIRTRG